MPSRAALQPREMMRQAERLAGVHGNQFVNAVAEDEAAVEDRDFRLAQWNEFTIEKHDLICVEHGRQALPLSFCDDVARLITCA